MERGANTMSLMGHGRRLPVLSPPPSNGCAANFGVKTPDSHGVIPECHIQRLDYIWCPYLCTWPVLCTHAT